MNTVLLSRDYEQIKGKINLVPYQINRSGKYPFLQYFLLKYIGHENITSEEEEEEEDETKEYVYFLKFEQRDNSEILEICAAALDILFLSYEEIDPKYKYNGHIFYEV